MSPNSGIVLVAGLVLLLLCPTQGFAYGLETHEALANEAFVRAGIDQRLPNYGLVAGQRVPGRILSLRRGPLPPDEWVVKGARDEDIPLYRVLNHFYDPAHDRGLTVPLYSGTRAPDWALEPDGPLPGQNHSYRDARDAFYVGLTRSDKVGRERDLGHTFYALGHVIHLIQDVSVPEHARNDAHLPLWSQKSFAEAYLNRNGAAFFPTELMLDKANMPTVKQARELWSNPAGTGIAQFTNANFVSPDTNFTEAKPGATAEEYTSPKLDLARRTSGDPRMCKDADQPVPPVGSLTFFANDMLDPVSADPANPTTLTNPRMTTYSLFDSYLIKKRKRPIFSLNCYTVDAAATILLPRAVSYSASLLEYFFRGRPTAIFGHGEFYVVNRTSDARRAEVMDGRFELYRDDGAGQRQLHASWSLRLDPDRTSGPLAVPLLPEGDPSRCILVFRGLLGEEADGVAGQQLDRCPTASTLDGPYVEVGLPAAGPGVSGSGCPEGFWRYLVRFCCAWGSSEPGAWPYCAQSPEGAVLACENSQPWWYVCWLA